MFLNGKINFESFIAIKNNIDKNARVIYIQ